MPITLRTTAVRLPTHKYRMGTASTAWEQQQCNGQMKRNDMRMREVKRKLKKILKAYLTPQPCLPSGSVLPEAVDELRN